MNWRQFGVLLSIFLLFSGGAVMAQPSFIVMSVKGKVEFKHKGKAAWQPVKVGMELQPGSSIKTSFASYVKLMMDNSRLVGVDENTEKPLADFVAQNKSGKDSKANTILAYAARQVNQTKKPDEQTEFGAVRGNMEVFNATFPKYSIMTEQPEFRIVDEKRMEKYELIVYDDEFNVITKQEITGDTFVYPKSLPQLTPLKTYYWKASRIEDGISSDVQRFTVLHPDTVVFITAELANLRKELNAMGADEIMHHLIRGVYFEQKQLYYNAYLEYKETISLAPDVHEYKDMLSNLFLKLSLYNEQEYLMRE